MEWLSKLSPLGQATAIVVLGFVAIIWIMAMTGSFSDFSRKRRKRK